MVNDINRFKSSLNNLGVQKTSKFSALIAPPMRVRGGAEIDDLIFRVSSINWPGISFSLDELKPMGYGLTEARPISRTTDEIGLTIMLDSGGRIYQMFNRWAELILPTSRDINNSSQLELYEYPIEYYGILELYIKDNSGNVHTRITFDKPFLSAIGSVAMAWDSVDMIVHLPVQIRYKSFKFNSTYSGIL